MDAQAGSAWSNFVPATDVLGNDNSDGHEVDFFARDGSGRDLYRAFRFDAAAQVIQKFAYDPAGGTVRPLGGPVVRVRSFSAQTFPASAMLDASTAVYNPLFAGATLPRVTISYGLASPVAG